MNDSSKAKILEYANSTDSAVSTYFTPPEQSSPVPFNNIVTTSMTNFTQLFFNANSFNKPISDWDTSKVTTMAGMFGITSAFNKPIGQWNTSNVTDMNSMFFNSTSFNENIGSWDTSKVTMIDYMFYNSTSFNQNLSGWNVALTTARPSLTVTFFADGSPLALPENSHKLPLFQ